MIIFYEVGGGVVIHVSAPFEGFCLRTTKTDKIYHNGSNTIAKVVMMGRECNQIDRNVEVII